MPVLPVHLSRIPRCFNTPVQDPTLHRSPNPTRRSNCTTPPSQRLVLMMRNKRHILSSLTHRIYPFTNAVMRCN